MAELKITLVRSLIGYDKKPGFDCPRFRIRQNWVQRDPAGYFPHSRHD